MNVYIIVEGDQTEMAVYPAWLSILAPNMKRIDDARDLTHDSYYIFCGHGIPQIFQHITNSVQDINEINASGESKYDFLLVCIDTEEGSKEDIEQLLLKNMAKGGVCPSDFQIKIFEQKVCMETWFLGNRRLFKENPSGDDMIKFLRHFNVKQNNPEDMESIEPFRWNKAKFHLKYLKAMLAERHLKYDKNKPDVVCTPEYLNELILRYNQTSHLQTFGSWFEFVQKYLSNNKL